ncbi:MAG: TRAP transporter small permease [Clostridia bacterium]|nr:TRAP transporter small permease [Clostridia bacterium]
MGKKILDNFEGYCCAIMIAVMSVVVFLQVFFRFVVKSSLPWSEELSRYLQVYITFFGTAYGIKTGAHLGVEAFVLLLPKKLQKYLNILVQLCSLAVCALILYFGVKIVQSQMASGQVSPAMRIPMWMIYIAIPIGMAFCIIRYVLGIVGAVKELGKKEEEVAQA